MKEKLLKLKDIQKLLDRQTSVILEAVDSKLQMTNTKITAIDQRLAGLEKRIGTFWRRFNVVKKIKKHLRPKTEVFFNCSGILSHKAGRGEERFGRYSASECGTMATRPTS